MEEVIKKEYQEFLKNTKTEDSELVYLIFKNGFGRGYNKRQDEILEIICK